MSGCGPARGSDEGLGDALDAKMSRASLRLGARWFARRQRPELEGGPDGDRSRVHRAQITFDALDTETGEVMRGGSMPRRRPSRSRRSDSPAGARERRGRDRGSQWRADLRGDGLHRRGRKRSSRSTSLRTPRGSSPTAPVGGRGVRASNGTPPALASARQSHCSCRQSSFP